MSFGKFTILILIVSIGKLNRWTEAVPLNINYGKLEHKFRTFWTGPSHPCPQKHFRHLLYICPEEGLQPYPDQNVRNKYILCMNFPHLRRWFYYIYQCPDGSYFNKEDKVCHLGSPHSTTSDPCERQRQKRTRGVSDDSDGDIICS